MRKVTREKWVRRGGTINQSCAQVRAGAKGWKLSNLPSKRARHGIVCGIDTSIDPALRGAKQFGEYNAIELRTRRRFLIESRWMSAPRMSIPWYWARRERDSARKESPTTPTTRRAGATHSRGRDAQRSTFHSYLLCDASLQPVESTRTFVNAFACSARWCDLHDYVCVLMVLAKRWLFGWTVYLGHLHHVIVSRCNFACCCCCCYCCILSQRLEWLPAFCLPDACSR